MLPHPINAACPQLSVFSFLNIIIPYPHFSVEYERTQAYINATRALIVCHILFGALHDMRIDVLAIRLDTCI